MRTIIIGDIHGCYVELQQLLDKVRFDINHDRLVLLGDLMDRGPSSYEVLNLAKRLRNTMKDRLVILRGSHEYMLLNHSKKLSDRLLWRVVGKGASVRSFSRNGEKLSDCALWVRENTVLFYEDELFQCAHAGILNERLADNDEHTLLMDHRLVRKNRYSGKLTVTGHIHLKKPTYFDGSGGKGKEILYRCWQNLPKTGVICIDTGCAEGNRLTTMIVDGESVSFEYVCIKDDAMIFGRR